MVIKRLFIMTMAAILLSGCGYFATGKRLVVCDSLLVQSKQQLIQSIVIIDSLQNNIDDLRLLRSTELHQSYEWISRGKAYSDSLIEELIKCQKVNK